MARKNNKSSNRIAAEALRRAKAAERNATQPTAAQRHAENVRTAIVDATNRVAPEEAQSPTATPSVWFAHESIPLHTLAEREWHAFMQNRYRGPITPERRLDVLTEVAAACKTLERPDFLAAALQWCWMRYDQPFLDVPREMWLEFFAQAGFVHDAIRTERPASVPVLYRGCAPGDIDGMAWTSNLEMARLYASMVPGRRVYRRTDVRPEDVIARFDTLDEAEWLVGTPGEATVHEAKVSATDVPVDRYERWSLSTEAELYLHAA